MKTPRTTEEAFDVIKPFVIDEMFQLLKSHVQLRGKSRGKRFTRWMKKFTLQLHFCGARAYRWLSNVRMLPGIIPGIVQSIGSSTKSWSKRDRVCTLIFDEMMLKKNLAYDVTQDVVQGFTDNGVERTSIIAD